MTASDLAPPPATGSPRPPDGGANQQAAHLVADQLRDGVIHPGDDQHAPFAIPLPFKTRGKPPELADQMRKATHLLSEAIVNAITSGGIALIYADELNELRENQHDTPPPPSITVTCPHDRPLLELVPRTRIRLHQAQMEHLAKTAQCQH